MYEESTAPDIDLAKGRNPNKVKANKSPYNWKIHTVAELIQFRDEITAALPPTELKEMNLEAELLLQFHSVRSLQSDVLADEEIPLNQRAQVANSVNATLSKLVEMQAEVYKQERFKAIEALVIRHLLKLPEEAAQAFLEDYERALESLK